MSEIVSGFDLVETDLYMWLTFGVIIFAMISYAMERISLEITSLLILIVTGYFPTAAFMAITWGAGCNYFIGAD